MKNDWASLSTDQLKTEALEHLQDHDDGSTAFFDPEQGLWRLEVIDPLKLSAFKSKESACLWIKEEIEYFHSTSDARGQLYQTMLDNGFSDPVIAGVSHEGAKLWDGYHRTAIAMARGESLPAVVGYSDPLVASLSGEPRIFSQRELEAMDIDILDMMAFGCKGGEILELDPKEILIKYPGDMDNPIEKFLTQGMVWVKSVSFDEPVEVSIGDDGKKYLEDGHHRRFCAIKLGRKIKAEIEVKGNPVAYILKRKEALALARVKVERHPSEAPAP